jgi:hypothetical protein
MGLLGKALVGGVNLRFRKPSAERQTQQLPVTFFTCRQCHRVLAFAEFRSRQRQQDVAKDGQATPGGVADGMVGHVGVRRGAKNRQRLRSCLPQDFLLGCGRDVHRNAHGLAIVSRMGGPDMFDLGFPLRELSFHGEAPWTVNRIGR